MPKTKSKLINLLPQEEFDASIIGRLLKWAMGTFRIIVIITEMIVMAAFLSRFWLDARNSDLNESINVKVAQIKSQSEFENEFRSTQNKLRIFAEIDKGRKLTDVLLKIVSGVPSDINLTSISFQETSAQIKGVSGSETSIAQIISNLDSEETFKEVSLGQVNQFENNPLLTVFNINLKY